jgi:hypothetical protein
MKSRKSKKMGASPAQGGVFKLRKPPSVRVQTSDKGWQIVAANFFVNAGSTAVVYEDREINTIVNVHSQLDDEKPWQLKWLNHESVDPVLQLILTSAPPHPAQRQHWWNIPVEVTKSESYPAGRYNLHFWCAAHREQLKDGQQRVHIEIQQYIKPLEVVPKAEVGADGV